MSRSPLSMVMRRGVSGSELIERREFLRRAALACGGAALGASGAGALAGALTRLGAESMPRVIVIGAGLAGLACAYELSRGGVRVTVVEARPRVGGRVHTMEDLVSGKSVEGGGEFVGSNHPLWQSYAQRFGVALREVDDGGEGVEHALVLNGQRVGSPDSDRLYAAIENLLTRLNAPAKRVIAREPWQSPGAETLDAMSVRVWMETQGEIEPRVKRLASAMLEADNGAPVERQSLLGLLAMIAGGGGSDFWEHSEDYRAAGGAQTLASEFARRLTGKILLGAPARTVRHEEGRASVTLADGKSLACDEVVLAVPPSVWGTIRFEPGLAESLRVQMGAASKLFAVAPDAYWKRLNMSSTALTDTDAPWIWVSTEGQVSPAGAENDPREVVCGFSAGSMSERLSAQTRPVRDAALLGSLSRLYPGETESVQTVRYTNWSADMWSRAGYSFPAPGEVLRACRAVREPVGALRLAGEHCSTAFPGYMEGALESGVRAAEGILAGTRGAAR